MTSSSQDTGIYSYERETRPDRDLLLSKTGLHCSSVGAVWIESCWDVEMPDEGRPLSPVAWLWPPALTAHTSQEFHFLDPSRAERCPGPVCSTPWTWRQSGQGSSRGGPTRGIHPSDWRKTRLDKQTLRQELRVTTYSGPVVITDNKTVLRGDLATTTPPMRLLTESLATNSRVLREDPPTLRVRENRLLERRRGRGWRDRRLETETGERVGARQEAGPGGARSAEDQCLLARRT